MSKTAIIYWSGTGNTEAMANAILEGIKSAGSDADLYSVSDVTAQKALEYDNLVLGCPAMGAEVLEESEFEPFFTELEESLGGKNVALFGSYGWGGGEWMNEWESRIKGTLVNGKGLIANEAPDDDAVQECKKLGETIAKL